MEKWENCYDIKTTKLSLLYKTVGVNGYGRTVSKQEDQVITDSPRVGRQPTHCQDDLEVLAGRNDHFMEVVNIINVHSEMRYKIPC